MLKLDDRDIQMLKVLSQEGRISKSELASRVNLSPTPCWERLKRLEKAQIIQSYHANISLKKIASSVTVFVAVELENHQAASFRQFEDAIDQYEEIQSCWAIGGGLDYFMHVVTTSIDSYQRLIDDLLDQKIGLARYFTYIVTKPVKQTNVLPFDVLLSDH